MSIDEQDKAFLKKLIKARETTPIGALPKTIKDWAILITLVLALVGGVSAYVISNHEVNALSNRVPLLEETQTRNTSNLTDLERRVAVTERHVAGNGIHQSPAEKSLATLRTIQPIRDDISALKSDMSSMRKDMKLMQESMKRIEANSH